MKPRTRIAMKTALIAPPPPPPPPPPASRGFGD